MPWAERLARAGDDPRRRDLAGWIVRLALAVPVVYHGAWNLGAEGGAFWAAEGLPEPLRVAVGVGELLAVVAIGTGALSRLAAAALVLIFVGAIPHHAAAGFSFKDGGWEPLVVYALLAVAVCIWPRPSEPNPGGLS